MHIYTCMQVYREVCATLEMWAAIYLIKIIIQQL